MRYFEKHLSKAVNQKSMNKTAIQCDQKDNSYELWARARTHTHKTKKQKNTFLELEAETQKERRLRQQRGV